jgi:hypothetical protein
VHAYPDRDNSGSTAVHRYALMKFFVWIMTNTMDISIASVINIIANASAPFAQWLKCDKRQTVNPETDGGNTSGVCGLCEQIVFQSRNSDCQSHLFSRGIKADFFLFFRRVQERPASKVMLMTYTRVHHSNFVLFLFTKLLYNCTKSFS